VLNRDIVVLFTILLAGCSQGNSQARVAAAFEAIRSRHWQPPAEERLADSAVRAMVAELDPHSIYLTDEELRWFEEDVRGTYGGVGIEVVPEGDLWRLTAIVPGAPAELAGLRAGDRIERVDGLVPGKTQRIELLKRLRGPVGGSVTLDVRSAVDGAEPRTVTLVRSAIAAQSVTTHAPLVDAHGVALVRIRQFQESTLEAFLRVERELLASGRLEGLLLDLRGNPGGLVDSARAIAERFIPSGAVHGMALRGQEPRTVVAAGHAPLAHVPVVVLVDAATASAAELLAAALRERVNATLVGERTYGKGTVQILERLRGGGALDVTVGEYRTACGNTIQARGLEPDVVFAGEGAARRPEREENLPRALRIEAPHENVVPREVDALTPIVRPIDVRLADAALLRARELLRERISERRAPSLRACLP
jgi:carboxyl-terminal processing protease